jgi:iron complex transport system substrate-binding protein
VKLFSGLWWIVLYLGLSGGRALQAASPLPASSAPLRIVDDRGAEVRLAVPPRRIVSLLPSLTETVCDLGACARVVATDRWSNWPEVIQTLPKVGGLDDPNLELIVAQRPDLVLVAPSSRLAQRLRSLGLTVAELDARDLSEARRVMQKVATLLGEPARAELRWQVLMADIQSAADLVPPRARGQRVYFEVSSIPYAAGESSFIGQLLAQLGARNVVPVALGPFPKLNPEFVVKADPSVIMVSVQEVPQLRQRPGWSGMKAIREGRVCALSASQVDVLARPGPRLGQGARVLAHCLARMGPQP